ncbi:MAG: helix-turn-helix domain-containing protein [Akkermansiaceae bacterium]|jgi:AraC-like DNA-binding protein|nr:helix-turn-helix domain-containing protein [Akkermansiaceae bacterium]
MPRIIRKALYHKLKELPELLEFQQDFELLSGMRLAFVDELGLGDDGEEGGERPPFCAAIHATEAGTAMCARTRHALLSAAVHHSACLTCDAGLNEVVVPLTISGIRAGYFMFGGTVPLSPSPQSIHKARHLLRKNGIDFNEEDLEAWMRQTPVVAKESLDAYRRIAQLAAQQIALKVTDQLVNPETQMPAPVKKACGFIRTRALTEDLHLSEVARHSGVSEGHLSRMFHHATGLTFREYVTQVRMEHATTLLAQTDKNITEIAYESGFQSLSQFHRVFRKVNGKTAGEMRAAGKARQAQ